MTISQAIEILTNACNHKLPITLMELEKAHKLGIEALTRIKAQRDFGLLGRWTELKSETKE